MTKRKTYTGAFKAKVVLELLREEKPLAQVAAEYEVHPSQLREWKQMAMAHLPSVFADSQRDQAQQQAEHERRLEQLYAEIGRLTTQLAWLKKKAGIEQLLDAPLLLMGMGVEKASCKCQTWV